ncbi:MAG: M48 family metallopeptidase [Nitrospira sp.]|nr:M48 family metallopeptidase [Nitrospira sp.]MBX7040864.1 M48 family metallopeptidase [Nitrospira sp.]MCW5794096.1 M48 family metallopeptidase [Nitrospira sp.]HMV58888.1 M48 family metallopeptidase [Nitrospira sp.]HMW86625.1 M48 family metallopeptidase [Nitrospira sp.]
MNATPNALCFGEGLPGAGVPCTVMLVEEGLRVSPMGESALAEQVVTFADMAVEAGGLDHDQLVVSWGTGPSVWTLYVKDPALIVAFRRAAPPQLTAHLERAAEQVRRARHSHRLLWGSVLGVVFGLGLLLWFGTDLMVEWAVARIPIEWEQKLGETVYQDFLSKETVLKEGPAVSAVQEMTQRLTEKIPNNPYKFQISVVQSPVVNAFALPGGYVVVFTGLMTKAESGEEVAGVLSHELNHVLQRHGMERMVKMLGLSAVVGILLGDQQGLTGLAKQVGMELVTLKFGRAQETEADVTGIRLLSDARIAPDGMIRFFERLSEKDKERVEVFSTHPMSAARAALLKAELAALPKRTPEPFTFQWKTIQDSLAVSEPKK